jgi:hypothetical protein
MTSKLGINSKQYINKGTMALERQEYWDSYDKEKEIK